MHIQNVAKIGVCESQPITIEGLKAVLSSHPLLALCGSRTALALANELIASACPNVVLLDKNFGLQPVLEWLDGNAKSRNPVPIVIWGTTLNEAESLRFLQSGARGIVRKTAQTDSIVACLSSVACGNTWMDESVFCDSSRTDRTTRCDLTPREAEVLRLVEHGLKNREIGVELGIRPGTVKIHLKHIFEKTGVRGRYGLAFNGLMQNVGPSADPEADSMDTLGPRSESCLVG